MNIASIVKANEMLILIVDNIIIEWNHSDKVTSNLSIICSSDYQVSSQYFVSLYALYTPSPEYGNV